MLGDQVQQVGDVVRQAEPDPLRRPLACDPVQHCVGLGRLRRSGSVPPRPGRVPCLPRRARGAGRAACSSTVMWSMAVLLPALPRTPAARRCRRRTRRAGGTRRPSCGSARPYYFPGPWLRPPRVARELERLEPPGLQLPLAPDPHDRRERHTQLVAQQATRPVRDTELDGGPAASQRRPRARRARPAGPAAADHPTRPGRPAGTGAPVQNRRPGGPHLTGYCAFGNLCAASRTI